MLRLSNLVFCVAIALIQGKEVCDHLGILPYEEMGCIPSFGDNGCPKSFDCSHYNVPKDACIYKGHMYRNREDINGTASCNLGCTCSTEQSHRPSITCAEIDCDWDVSENCYRTHALDSCCPAGEKCPPFVDLATCRVDGKTHKEGQYFQPEGQCLECVCNKGFNGEFVEPFCGRVRCDVELRFSNEISDGCAPAYTRTADALCCPIDYICPSIAQVDNVVVQAINSEEDNDKCVFGSQEFNFNDTMDLTYKKNDEQKVAQCSCILPPLLTCRTDF